MSDLRTWRAKLDQVTFERFEDELVLVRFDSGNYYSFNRSGADAWILLQDGATAGAIGRTLAAAFGKSGDQIRADLDAFLTLLAEEDLVAPFEGDSQPCPPSLPGCTGFAYDAPAFRKYTDMQELLLLDPIHEVDDGGWPDIKPAGKTTP